MAGEEDSTIGLPKPPPPAQRDAAIDAALRKFDGEAPSAVGPSKRPEPWTVRRRYQLGAFATAALALLIFVPVALTGVSQDSPTSDTREVPRPQRPTLPDVEEPAPVEAPRSTAEPVTQTPTTPPPVARSPAPTADAAEDQAAKAQDARQRAPSPVVVVESPVIPPMSPPALARMNAPRPPTPPPPPPPGAPQAVADRAEQQVATGEIVVTGTRLNESKAARAATVNDNVAFVRRLQARIRANDRGAVARLVALPLRVNGPGGPRTYRDRRSVERDFDQIFTARVRQAVLSQRPTDILVRDQGAMIGNGELWFNRTCPNAACNPPGSLRITAVNP